MIAETMVHALLVSGTLTLAGLMVESVMRGRGYPRRWGWMGVMAGSAIFTVGLLLSNPETAPAPDLVKEGERTAQSGAVAASEGPSAVAAPSFPSTILLNLERGGQTGLDGLASMTGAAANLLERNPFGEMGLALVWGLL
jgi:hypothetical protein